MARTAVLRKLLILALILVVTVCLIFLLSTWLLKRTYPMRYKDVILQYSLEYELDPYGVCGNLGRKQI